MPDRSLPGFCLCCITGMVYKNDTDKRNMLEWEKVNATEHVRKAQIAEQEKLDSRVIVIENKYV